MRKDIIKTTSAPEAIGPYSQAVKVGNFLFISGQIPLDIQGKIVGNDIATQTKQALNNLKAIIESTGMTLLNAVKCTCYLRNMIDFPTFNIIYAEYFGLALPARECVEVAKLPKDVLVEISAICIE